VVAVVVAGIGDGGLEVTRRESGRWRDAVFHGPVPAHDLASGSRAIARDQGRCDGAERPGATDGPCGAAAGGCAAGFRHLGQVAGTHGEPEFRAGGSLSSADGRGL
jgi:hypothetical protein